MTRHWTWNKIKFFVSLSTIPTCRTMIFLAELIETLHAVIQNRKCTCIYTIYSLLYFTQKDSIASSKYKAFNLSYIRLRIVVDVNMTSFEMNV
jgi:hypothetical protein